MTNVSTKSTVVSLMVETTEGTLKRASGATKFVPVRDGFTMSPAMDQLSNNERKASIAAGKTQTGAENPTVSMPFYPRGSGVAGTQPMHGPLYQACFGAVDVETVEYDTVASSTVSAVNVDTGEGANYRKGQPLRVQYTDRSHAVRAVHSISGDVLTPAFDLPASPGSGISLGKAITYYGANQDHPTLSVVEYGGNEGFVEAVAGLRVTSLGITLEAGQYADGTSTLEGLAFHWNPLEVTSSKRYFDWTDDSGTYAAAIDVDDYDPYEVCDALNAAINATASTEPPVWSYDDATGKFSVVGTGTLLTLEWNTGANTANTIGTLLGFSVAADDSGTAATTGYTADNALSYAAPYTPTYDSPDLIVAKNQSVMIGDHDDYAEFDASRVTIQVSQTRGVKGSIVAESGRGGSRITGRATTVQVQALLDKHNVDWFRRYRSNADTRFQLTFGQKEGGNWVPSETLMFYLAHSTVSELALEDLEGQYALNMTLTGYAPEDSSGEVFFAQVD